MADTVEYHPGLNRGYPFSLVVVLRPLVEGGNGADADRTPQTSSVHSDPLLATKLFVLHPRTQHVNRSHHIERLQQGMERTFTLVSAPASFGKTTLLAQWLAECRTVVAWLSLEAEDVVLVIEDRRSLVERFHSHSVFLSIEDKLSLSPQLYSSRVSSIFEQMTQVANTRNDRPGA